MALGFLRDELGNSSGALEAYEIALKIFDTTGNQGLESIALSNIGTIYQRRGRYSEALEYYQPILTIARENGNRAVEGIVLSNIGDLHHNQGDLKKALDYYQQALEIARQEHDRSSEARVLGNLGNLYRDQSRYPEALEHYHQALTIMQQENLRIEEGTALNNIGQIYSNQGRYGKALEYYQQSLEISTEMSDNSGLAGTLNNIGEVYHAQGRYEEALDFFAQALAIARKIGERAGEGTVLSQIGGIYGDKGRYGEALDYYQQALTIMRQVGDRRGEAATLNNIGGIYYKQERLEKALEYIQQARQIAHDVEDHAGEGTFINNIGAIYREQGHYSEALDSLQQAFDILRDVGNRHGEGIVLVHIGGVYQRQDDYDEALIYYQQALTIMREVGDRNGEATTLHNIGVIYQNQENYGKALDFYQQALYILRQVGNRNAEGVTLSSIAELYQEQSQVDNALDHYEQAMAIFEEQRTIAGSELGRAGFIAKHADLYDYAVELYHQQGQNEEAFRTSERGRARSFLDSMTTGVVQLYDDEAQALWDQELAAYIERQATQDALARAKALNPPNLELVANLEAQLAESEETHSAALSAIEARGGQLADLMPGRTKQVSLSEIQQDLDSNMTLVSYHILGEEETLAFILTSDKLKVVPLDVGSLGLKEQITTFHASFTNPFLDQADPHSSKELQQLHEWLITPLKPHINPSTGSGQRTPEVTIIPHGILHYLPFAALTNGETYLSEHYVLSTLPSASVLPSIQENRKADTVIKSVLALGNPTFDPELARQEGLTLSNLPFARQEVESLTDLFGDQVEAHFGSDATESTLTQAGQTNILHIAAHGVYNPQQPLNSKLFLAPDADADSEATNDGVLEVGKVYGLELTDAMLVVLSACETGLRSLNKGDEESIITDGDEIVALNRAFLFAGTPTVLSTLWSVDDASTGLLMERFYTHLRDGKGKAEALRQAQIDVQEEYPHPYYWAGFVLSGDGGEIEAQGSWNWLYVIGLVGLLVVVGLLVGGLILRQRRK